MTPKANAAAMVQPVSAIDAEKVFKLSSWFKLVAKVSLSAKTAEWEDER